MSLPLTGQDRPELQKAIEEIVDSGFAGVQLRVNDEQGEWVGSAGVRKLGESAKPPTDGRFRIGSTTKTFTATVVLRLVAEGRIGLDSPADDYLPRFGLDRRITVRMLLQHTSGLFNFTGEYYDDGTVAPGIPWQGQEYVDNQFHTYRPEELVRLALSKPARFEPGTDWSYSNTNYVLARLLVESVTGRSFAEEMQRLILRPLGLSGTVVPDASPEIPEPHAHGYYRYEHAGQWKTADVTRSNVSWISAAGDMISTTEDLHTFVSALMSGKLLPDSLLAEMRTPHPKLGYGLGLFVEETDGGTVLSHNGGIWGWAALMYSTPDGSRTLTASLTTGDAELDFAATAEAFQKAHQRLVKEVFGSGRAEPAHEAAEPVGVPPTAPFEPVLTRHTEAETCADPSSVMTLLADSDRTADGFTSYRSTFAKGAVGAPAHFHTKATELFFVISGSLRVLVGEEITVLNAGDFLAVPPHTPHAFAAAPGCEADVLFVFTPGMGRFDYLRLLGRVMRGEADAKEIAESAERFDNHYVDSPLWRAALETTA